MYSKRLILAVTILSIVLVGISPAVAKEKPIKVGVMFSMTGKAAGYGKSAWQAVQLAVDEINASGGILGRPVEVLHEDSKCKPEIGVQIAKKYILKEKVDFIVGPSCSSTGLAVSDVCRQYKKMLVVVQSATDVITGTKFHPYVFSVLSNALMSARSGASLMADKPYKRWLCVAADYSWGHSSWNVFKDKLLELRPDVEIVDELFPKIFTADYTPYINKILKVKPDAVWVALFGTDVVTFIKQGIPFKLFDNIKFVFPVGASMEVLVPMGKDMPEGLYTSTRYFFTTPNSEMNRNFVKAYYDRYKEYPSYMAEEAYAGIQFLKAAVERAGTTDTEKVIEAVEREPLAWETPEGWKIMRKGDHLAVEDVVWGETEYSDKYGFAILKNPLAIQAEEIIRTNAELKEIRDNYDKNK